MSTDLENLREKLENEAMRKSDAMRHFLKLRLKSNFGSHAMKLKVWDALKSLRVLVLNSKPKLLKMKSLLMFSRPKLPMPKSQRVDLDQTLMIFQWNMRESMLLLSLLRSVQRTLTRFLENGCLRPMMFKLKLQLPRMRLLSNLILSSVKIRILLMRSKTSSISLEKGDALFMILISSAADWKQKRKNCRLHWKKQKLP